MRTILGLTKLAVLGFTAAMLAACGDMAGAYGGGGAEFGATAGGVKDLTLARKLVSEGKVPPAAALLPEAMFAEHDLPLTGDPCTTTLCLRGALGLAPTVKGEDSGWLQVGMSSNVDPEHVQRPSVTFIATVDVSGSMGWDYDAKEAVPTPGRLSRELLEALVEKLDGEDRFAMVTYGSDVDVALTLTGGADKATINRAIDKLDTNGSTNMEAGLKTAIALAKQHKGSAEETRILLFTDTQPNVGATQPSEFEQLVKAAADDGISITVFGLGLGMGPDLFRSMAHLRGGNGFSLVESKDVTKFVADQWPWFTFPIAYDLKLDLKPANGFTVEEAYGFPKDSANALPELAVSSVFLSKNKGAMLVRLADGSSVGLEHLAADVNLSYVTRDGHAVSQTLPLAWSGEKKDARGQAFQQHGVGRTVALALLVGAMHDAAAAYPNDKAGAAELLEPAVKRFEEDAAALGDEDLAPEVEFGKALLSLVKGGAAQGTFSE